MASESDRSLDAAIFLLHPRFKTNSDKVKSRCSCPVLPSGLERRVGMLRVLRERRDTVANCYAEEVGKMLAPNNREPVACREVYSNCS